LRLVTQTQTGMTNSVQCERDAGCVVSLWGHNSSWISSWTTNVIWRRWKGWMEALRRKSWQCCGSFCWFVIFSQNMRRLSSPHPLYSPDLALLYTQLKSILKGWWF
jgi:hypothetical protein